MLMLQTNMVNWWEQMMPAGTTDKPSEEWPVLSYKWTAEQIAWARGKNVAGCLPWNKVDTVCYDTNGIHLFFLHLTAVISIHPFFFRSSS